MSKILIDCDYCTGHGIGRSSPDSDCHKCNGRGYHKVDTRSDDWIDHCIDNDLDIETGETKDESI